MVEKTIEELLELINSKKVTSEELVKESLELAHKYQEEYNSFVTICDDASGEESQSNSPLIFYRCPKTS